MVGEAVTFTAQLESEDGGVFFRLPIDVRSHFGRARPPVLVTLRAGPPSGAGRGHSYRSTPAVYGGVWYLVVNKANRQAAGVAVGDDVEVTLEEDTAPREVEVPPDLRAALDADTEASARFAAMSYSHRREYIEWIEEAKRAETRQRRIAKCVDQVRAGRSQR